MYIVINWLYNVGLNHVIPEFQSQGINSAEDLVKLQFADYAALGVVNSDDRKKLYYLIQRIKMEIGKESPNGQKVNEMRRFSQHLQQQEQAHELEDSRHSYGESSDNSILDSVDHEEDDTNISDTSFPSLPSSSLEAPKKLKLQVNSSSLKAKEAKMMPARRSARLQKLRESGECHVDLYGRECKNKSGSPSSSPSKAPVPACAYESDERTFLNSDSSTPYNETRKENYERYESKDYDRRSLGNTSTEQLPRGFYSTQHKSPAIARSTIYDKENKRNDSLKSQSSLSTIRSSQDNTKIKSRRESIDAQSQNYQLHDSPSKVNSRLQHAVLTYSSPGGPRKSKSDTLFPEIQKVRKECPKPPCKIYHDISLKTPSIKKNYQRSSSSSVSTLSNASSTCSRSSITSRSTTQNSPTNLRDGRNIQRLSSIPSEKAAAMSPLAKKTSAQFDQVSNPGRRQNKENASSRSESKERSSSNSRDNRRISAPIQFSNTSIVSSRVRSDDIQSKLSAKASNVSVSTSHKYKYKETTRQRCNSSSSRHSTGSYCTSSTRSVSSVDSRKSNKSSSRKIYPKKTNNDRAVFVHGIPKDNSWGTQVLKHREVNEDMYKKSTSNLNQTQQFGEMRIRVAVRKRPISSDGEVDVIHPIDCDGHGKIICYQPKTRVDLTKEIETTKFSFDNVFNEQATNVDIYKSTVRNLIPGVFAGEWATVFAYGQTGSGKTFTMMGSGLTGINAGNQLMNKASKENLGLYYLAALDLFQLAQTKYPNVHIGASLFEIYSGKLYDLLNERKVIKCLEDHKGKVCFPGLSEHPVSNARRLMDIIESGAANRSTGSTSVNADSSRSHAVLQLRLRKTVGSKQNVEHGCLTFIDLAGSERGADTYQASRTTRLEGAEINTSLLALKEVIRALATGDSMSHIPFRGSKLTQVLKQSFVGTNSRTVMITCVAPDLRHCEHTLNTLRYADRVKERNAETGKAVIDAFIYSKTTKTRMPAADNPSTTPSASSDRQGFHHLPSTKKSRIMAQNITYYSSDEEHHRFKRESKYEMDNDDWSSEGSEISNDENYCKEKDKQNESLRLLAHQANFDDCSSASSLASCTETNVKHVPSESHAVVTKNKATKESFQTSANKLIVMHRSITTSLLNSVKKDMLLVNGAEDISDRTEFDSYLKNVEMLQGQQLDLIKDLRETLVEFYSKRRAC